MKTTIIGSGFGGIAAALRLRAMGHEVTLLEKLDEVGGRAQQFKREKYIQSTNVCKSTFAYHLTIFGNSSKIEHIQRSDS